MKTNAIVRIVIFSLAIMVLLAILIAVLGFNIYMADGKIHWASHDMVEEPIGVVNQGIVAEEVRNIEIEWVAGSITIQADDNAADITITEYASPNCEHQMVWKQSGQTLKIQYSRESIEFPSFGINVDTSKELVIIVPSGWTCNTLEVETASATMDVTGLTIREFDFDGASGVCNITDCNVDELDIDTASGNVTFAGTLKNLDCDAASANCSITVFNTPASIEMDAASGDLELILPEDTGFTCHMETMSGEFESYFEFENQNGAYVHGDGSCQIKVSAMSGDVCIYKGVSHHSGHHPE